MRFARPSLNQIRAACFQRLLALTMACVLPTHNAVGLRQSWEAIPANSQGRFTVGAIPTASTLRFLPTAATVAGTPCAIIAG